MPTPDDNPLAGFELVNHPNGTFLHCRARGCFYSNHLVRILKLEWLLYHAAKHRATCKKHIQHAPTLPVLPFRITTEEVERKRPIFEGLVEAAENAIPAPIAYTLGSFWYCVEHGLMVEGAHPESPSNLLPEYQYNCDTCGKLIRKQLVSDGE